MIETKTALRRFKEYFDTLPTLTKQSTSSESRSRHLNVVNTFDISPSAFFYGREQIIDTLHEAVRPSDTAGLKKCILHGLGGAGKTQVAAQFVHKYKNDYHYIFLVRAEKQAQIAPEFGDLASKIKSDASGSTNQQSNIQTVLDYLSETGMLEKPYRNIYCSNTPIDKSWLLIFDNVVDAKHITPYFPHGNGSIIVTTQSKTAMTMDPSNVEVKTFSPDDGARLLQKYLKSSTESFEDARELSGLVGGLPLSIAHIAGFLVESSTTLKTFKDIFHRRDGFVVWQGSGPATYNYERSLETAFDIALEALTEKDPFGRELLDIIAFLDPDSIQEEMVLDFPYDLPSTSGPTADLGR
jgi:hypothetical protein